MRTICFFLLFSLLEISFVSAQQLDTEEYKFKMDIPEGFKFKTSVEGGFGIMEGYEAESQTYLYALAYIGEASKRDIYDYGIELTEIPESAWNMQDKGQKDNGFAWWEIYKANHSGRTLYAIIAKNGGSEISYLFFVLAPNASFQKYEGDYLKWISSCKGV